MNNDIKNMLYQKSKEFLENFSLDYAELKIKLEEIMNLIFSFNKVKKKMYVSFDESRLFGKFGSVSEDTISFNKTRIEMLSALKIDDLSENHLQNLENFYKNYHKKTQHTDFEIILFEFIEKYKALNAERYFCMIGSYKTIKYEILNTIYHECEHVIQDDYKKYLECNNLPTDITSKVLIFTALFNTMFEFIRKEKIKLFDKPENHIFPIEFDAIFIGFKTMKQLYELFFKNDAIFKKYLAKSIVVPPSLNIPYTARKIFKYYQKLYLTFIKISENKNKYELINNYVLSNIKQIIKEFENRYAQMLEVLKNS